MAVFTSIRTRKCFAAIVGYRCLFLMAHALRTHQHHQPNAKQYKKETPVSNKHSSISLQPSVAAPYFASIIHLYFSKCTRYSESTRLCCRDCFEVRVPTDDPR